MLNEGKVSTSLLLLGFYGVMKQSYLLWEVCCGRCVVRSVMWEVCFMRCVVGGRCAVGGVLWEGCCVWCVVGGVFWELYPA